MLILGPKIQKRYPLNPLVERYGPLVDACQTENQWTGTDRYKTSVKPTSGPIHSYCINIRPSEGLSDPTQPQQRTHFTPAMKMRPIVEFDCPHIALITTAPTRTRIYRFSKNHYASLPHENQFTHLWNPNYLQNHFFRYQATKQLTDYSYRYHFEKPHNWGCPIALRTAQLSAT